MVYSTIYFMKKTLYQIIFFCFFISFTACGSKKVLRPPTDTSSGTTRVIASAPVNTSTRTHGSNNCSSTLISNEECFYPLPVIQSGRTYVGTFEDTETSEVTVGKGEWLCQDGIWYQLYRPTCLTCLPGHSLAHCKNALEETIRGLNRNRR